MAESPKRRKCKDNPYTLNYIEEKNIYIVSFKHFAFSFILANFSVYSVFNVI